MRHVSRLIATVLLIATSAIAQNARQKAPQRPAITGVAFISFYTADLAASQHFYSDVIGLQRIAEANRSTYPIGRSQWIEVVPSVPDDTHRLHAVGFTTSDAVALQRYLASKGYPAEGDAKGGEFSVKDPEGNLVTFVQSGSERSVAQSVPSPRATSHRIIHVGFVVRNEAGENKFWRETLGFRPYWRGGHDDASTDYVAQQVPDGTDWLEYMLNTRADPSRQQLGVSDHVSLGVEKIGTVVEQLQENGCTGPNCTAARLGRDGKVQLNLFDPDLSRIEFMEFKPSGKTCCSAYTGPHPSERH